MLSLLYVGVKAQQYFVSSSYMFLDTKTLLKIWLNPLSKKRALQVSRRDLIVNKLTFATLKTQPSQGIAFLSPNNNHWKNNMKQQQHERKK